MNNNIYQPSNKEWGHQRRYCICDVCSLKTYQQIESMNEQGHIPSKLTPPWMRNWQTPHQSSVPQQPLKPHCSPRHSCGLAFDHKNLPRLVAVHSLRTTPIHVMHAIRKSATHPIAGLHVDDLQIKDEKTEVRQDKSGEKHCHIEIKHPAVKSEQQIEDISYQEGHQLPDTGIPNMDKLVLVIKEVIPKIQQLRRRFHEEQRSQTKRHLLDQLLLEREKLKELRGILQQMTSSKPSGKHGFSDSIKGHTLDNTTGAQIERSLVKISSKQALEETGKECSPSKRLNPESLRASPSKRPRTDLSSKAELTSSKSVSTNEGPYSLPPKTPPRESVASFTVTQSPEGKIMVSSAQDAPQSEGSYCISLDTSTDLSTNEANLDRDNEDESESGYKRCAGILEPRCEGDNFICNEDEWTMQLDKQSPKAVFRRCNSKRRFSFDGVVCSDNEPMSKKPSFDLSDDVFESASDEEYSDEELFKLENPQSSEQEICQQSDEENEEAISKLGRRLQIRDGKIHHLSQKRDNLIIELRKMSYTSRNS